jgi:hypothetical protein
MICILWLGILPQALHSHIFYTQQVEELELELEQQILRGGLLPPDTRVLHFKHNPLSAALEKDARQTADILRENEALKAR